MNHFLLHSHFTYGLAGRKGVAEFAHGAFENGMACVSGDFDQWLKDEAALVQFGVRYGQRGEFDDRAAEQQDIYVDGPGAFLLLALASHALLKVENA